MDATPLGFKIGQTPFDDISEINFGSEGYSCGTGTFFDKDTKIENRPLDMEAYAIAKICYLENIRFKCFKFISDHADGGASNDWIENVSLGKKLFVKRIKNLGFYAKNAYFTLKKVTRNYFRNIMGFSFSIKIPNYCHKALPLNI